MRKSVPQEEFDLLTCKIIKFTTSSSNYVIYEVEFEN